MFPSFHACGTCSSVKVMLNSILSGNPIENVVSFKMRDLSHVNSPLPFSRTPNLDFAFTFSTVCPGSLWIGLYDSRYIMFKLSAYVSCHLF